jgi:hypothetical protein
VDAAASRVQCVRRAVSRERATARRTSGAESAFAKTSADRGFWCRRAAYGKTVWSWHPLLMLRLAEMRRPNRAWTNLDPRDNGGKTNSSPGRARHKPKTIAQGMPECSGCTCMLVCAFFAHLCTRDRGCSKHPAFPAPSFWRERKFGKARAHGAARRRGHASER